MGIGPDMQIYQGQLSALVFVPRTIGEAKSEESEAVGEYRVGTNGYGRRWLEGGHPPRQADCVGCSSPTPCTHGWNG